MKIIRTQKPQPAKFTLRLDEELRKQILKEAEKHDISSQRLIEEILRQVLNDKSFVLRIED